jgi:putative FmdB family regulatory protein
MPNYGFTCGSCGEEFDQIVPYEKRDDLLECPKCGKTKGKRQISVPAMSYAGAKSDLTRAGAGWNDMLKKIKSGSGRRNTIKTK